MEEIWKCKKDSIVILFKVDKKLPPILNLNEIQSHDKKNLQQVKPELNFIKRI